MKNKKGQVVLITMMIAFLAFAALVQIIGPMKDIIEDARSPTGLDCENTSISDATKGTCVITDYTLFGYAGAVIFAAMAGIGAFLVKKKVSQ